MVSKWATLHLPKDLYTIVKIKSDYEKEGKAPKKPEEIEECNKESYILKIDRLVDPIILGIFYGLYKSKELPPEEEEEITLDKKYDFYVKIDQYKNVFNHLLFCLWVKKNGFPKKPDIGYRGKLYNFTIRILDDDYFTKVVIPFYLKEASESKEVRPFISRMLDSGFHKYKIDTSAPEYLAREFFEAQNEFKEKVIDAPG